MKFKVTVTTIKEFETTLEDYGPGMTEQDALKCEQDAAKDDPYLSAEDGDTTVIVERID